MFDYYRLTSQQFNGMLVRQAENGHEEYFNQENHAWEPVGILARYLWPDSDTYGMYDELTESEVNKLTA